MAFRTVIVDSHSKLEYSLNYLVFRTPQETKRVMLDEIHTLILQSTAISITTSLLAELTIRKIKVIICDEKKNPVSEIAPYFGAHNCSKRLLEQIGWAVETKSIVWQRIIQQKICNQANTLKKLKKADKAKKLFDFATDVEFGDATNREGHAAKVYFNNMFYDGFTREDDSRINAYLNYGYTILLSQFNRTIISAGYVTQIGIHHKSEFNQFNFSCDLMEPFRFLIDEKAMALKDTDDFKTEIVNLLSMNVIIDGKSQSLVNAINLYAQSVFNALNDGKVSDIVFVDGYDI